MKHGMLHITSVNEITLLYYKGEYMEFHMLIPLAVLNGPW